MTAERGQGEERSISRETVLSLYLPAAVLALGMGIAAPAIPVYAKSFDISFGTASLVFIVHAFGMLVATFPTGYLVDKLGRKPIIIAGPALTALSAILTAFAGSFEELLVYRFLNGTGTVMWNHARLAIIADTGGNRERGKLITWMQSMQRFGMILGPALGGFLATYDIRAPFIVHGVLVLLTLMPSFKLVRETKPQTVSGGAGDKGEWSYIFSEIRKPQILYFFASQMLAGLTRGSGQVLNLYIVYAYSVGPGTLGLISTVNSVITLPIGFSTGVIMDRYGRKMTVVPGFAGTGVAAFFLALTALTEASFGVFLVAFYALHLAESVTFGNMQVLGSDLAPERARGRFFAIWRLFGEIGTTSSPMMFTWLAVAAGYASAFAFLGFSALAVATIIGFKIKETVGRVRKVSEAPKESEPAARPAG